jgi:hypothetical protein
VEYAYVKQNKMTLPSCAPTGTLEPGRHQLQSAAVLTTRASPDLTEQPGKDDAHHWRNVHPDAQDKPAQPQPF